MLTQQELAELTSEEKASYESAGKFEREMLELRLRDVATQRAASKGRSIAIEENWDDIIGKTAVTGAKEYKLLTSNDKGFFGKFDAENIERVLNVYARQGWVVSAATTSTFRGIVAPKDELMIVLERALKT